MQCSELAAVRVPSRFWLAVTLSPLRPLGRRPLEMAEAVAAGPGGARDRRRRRKGGSNAHVVAQLLDSPLPTPRRSCCGLAAADVHRGSGDDAEVSPQRGHVPFAWESSPGVPRSVVGSGGKEKEWEVVPPKPPPGRCGARTPCHAHARGYCHCDNSDGSSDGGGGGEDDDDRFSDALGRISSSDRLAALSARLSSVDGVVGSLRLPSFIMDRFLPAANSIAATSADRHPKRPSRRCSALRSKHEEAAAAAARARARHVMSTPRRVISKRSSPPPQSKGAAAHDELPPLADDVGYQMSPRACGLLFFVPWSAKPVLFGFPRSPARCRTPHAAAVAATTAPSPPRRSVKLSDVLEKDRTLPLGHGDLTYWYDGEISRSGKERTSLAWGAALLGTSKRYCADARKALSRLTRSSTDGGDSPRISRERRSGKPPPALRSTSGRMPPLSPPSESWLSHLRGSSAVNNK